MNSLSANEKRKLASAMNRLIEKGRYIDIGSFQSAFICKKNRNWVSEKNVDFCNERGELDGSISYPDIYSIKVDTLPWHRLFVVLRFQYFFPPLERQMTETLLRQEKNLSFINEKHH